MYLAKSFPKETIQEHTDNLLKNYYILREIYGDKMNINLELLKIACIYHDIGKINRDFQYKLNNSDKQTTNMNIPHAYLSILFLDFKKLRTKYGFNKLDIKILINTIAHHHKREEFDEDMISKIIRYSENYLQEDMEKFSYDKLEINYRNINTRNLLKVNSNALGGFKEKEINQYILLKGLLNKIDYAASGQYPIETRNDFLMTGLENYKNKYWDGSNYNDLQKYMIDNTEENIIAIAETGYGKTEAGLLWIGDNKGFFTLPLKTAINETYDRISKKIIKDNIYKKVGILHSDTISEYVFRNNNNLEENIIDYTELTRELSIPLTISTIDQLFDFVYKYVGFERKLATLSYSKIVIDEIQMYSSDLVAYIIIAIKKIVEVGGKVAIITATFPPIIETFFKKYNIEFKKPNPYFKNRIRHSMKIIEQEINSDFILDKYKNNKVLVIVNTVKKLNEIYDELKDEKIPIKIFHSGFIRKDRRIKEKDIINFAQINNNETGIWICTQVAEASLDIDFDILVTELSDLNGLFQRMGRCYRNRELDTEYNIYLFDGGENLTSGIGRVNDKDIYLKSKDILRKKGSGKITEIEKLNLIQTLYSKENLKDTKYYKKIEETIDYIESIYYEEFKEKDVKKYFRNIQSIDIIPKKVYEYNKIEIEDAIKILKNQKNTLKIDKIKARITINEFKVSINYFLIKESYIERIDINKYESLIIYNGCDYSLEKGIRFLDMEEKEDYQEFII